MYFNFWELIWIKNDVEWFRSIYHIMWIILLNHYNTVVVSIHKRENLRLVHWLPITLVENMGWPLQKSSRKAHYDLEDLAHEPTFVCDIKCSSTVSWKSFSYCSHLADITILSAYLPWEIFPVGSRHLIVAEINQN